MKSLKYKVNRDLKIETRSIKAWELGITSDANKPIKEQWKALRRGLGYGVG